MVRWKGNLYKPSPHPCGCSPSDKNPVYESWSRVLFNCPILLSREKTSLRLQTVPQGGEKARGCAHALCNWRFLTGLEREWARFTVFLEPVEPGQSWEQHAWALCLILILPETIRSQQNKLIHYLNVSIHNYLICKFGFYSCLRSINTSTLCFTLLK